MQIDICQPPSEILNFPNSISFLLKNKKTDTFFGDITPNFELLPLWIWHCHRRGSLRFGIRLQFA